MSSPGRKSSSPILSSMLGKKKSPAGAVDLPPELPTIQLDLQNLPKPTSPINVSNKIDNIVKKFSSGGKDLKSFLSSRGFTITEDNKYLTSKEDNTTIAYYVKAYDKYGTPVYICLGSFSEKIELDANSFNGDMIKVRENNVNISELNYVISSNKNDSVIECEDGSFCVVIYKDDGTVVVDRFHIPDSSELISIKNEIDKYQVSDNKKISTPVTPVNYSIIQYRDIENGISNERFKEFYNTFNKSITDLKSLSDKNFDDFSTRINNLKVVIEQTMGNRKIGFDKIQALKKAVKINFDGRDMKFDETQKLHKYNEALEKYIILSNQITKLQYEAKIVYDGIVEYGNKFYDTYEDVTK